MLNGFKRSANLATQIKSGAAKVTIEQILTALALANIANLGLLSGELSTAAYAAAPAKATKSNPILGENK